MGTTNYMCIPEIFLYLVISLKMLLAQCVAQAMYCHAWVNSGRKNINDRRLVLKKASLKYDKTFFVCIQN